MHASDETAATTAAESAPQPFKEPAMHQELSQQDLQRIATRYVKRKIGFFFHFTVYLVVNIALVGANILHAPDAMWSFAPLTGWGIGLLFHGLAIFLSAPGAGWRQRMIDNEVTKLKQRSH
jgi:hypothetical protein